MKRGIGVGLVPRPGIWLSGAFISQSGGGDFRLPTDIPARPGDFTHSEEVGAAAIADARMPSGGGTRTFDAGASQVKLMAGGGVSSSYEPLSVTQYTVPELRAAAEAAEDRGTYVAVGAARQALEAGIRCFDHGQRSTSRPHS